MAGSSPGYHPTSLAVLNIAAIVERCDEQILPAVFLFLGRSLNASLHDLGILTLCRAIVQALASPLAGILGHRYNRTAIVAAGCTLWGIMTSAIGLSTSLPQAMSACAINGFGLALVIPTLSSLVADSTAVGVRGRAFGVMGLIASLGGMAGALFATNVGGKSVLGVEGWRCAFHAVAAVSLGTAWLVRRYAVDPSYGDSSGKKEGSYLKIGELSQVGGWEIGKMWYSVRSVLQIRSFQVIVLQGIVGSIPWQAMAMMTLWLQLLSFSNLQASILTALFTLGCATGGLLGGVLGDAATRRSPLHGRIAVCQLSVFLGLPLSFLLFKGLALPRGGEMVLLEDSGTAESSTGAHAGHALLYAVVLLTMGLSISWCGANNSALFAELVPEQQRTHVYAFDRSFEGAVGACGAPLVGIAAERLFGFQSSMAAAGALAIQRTAAAKAISSALLLCLVVPWTLCLLSYTFLHATYPRDKASAVKLTQQAFLEEGLHGSGCELKVETWRDGGAGVGVPGTARRRPTSD